MAKIEVKGTEITIYSHSEEDFICITDIARHKNAERTDDLIRNWIRNRNTIEFLGIWEMLNNPDFKPVEFDGFKKQAGLNSFIIRVGPRRKVIGGERPLQSAGITISLQGQFRG